MKTSLQPEDDEYVYTIFTVDSNGIRYPFIVNGGQVILPSSTTNYQIPVAHEHPYYQCAVAKLTDSGEYKILSYSNKVDNPLYYKILHVEDIEDAQAYGYCMNDEHLLGAIVYGEAGCPEGTWEWEVEGGTVSQTGDSFIIADNHTTQFWNLTYHGCSEEKSFHLLLLVPNEINFFKEPYVWKRQGGSVSLAAVDDEIYAWGDFNCVWSTGETTNHIEATEAGNYSVIINAYCCSDTCSIEVRDNVEIDQATIDLKTGRTKVTWKVTPEQAEYIDKVKVVKNGSAYSASYTQGYYLFSGVDGTPQNYHIIAVPKDDENGPVPSYERGTVYASYHEDEEGNLNMDWNIPYVEQDAPIELTGFQVCKYNPSTDEVTVVNEVDATVTNYTCSSDLFFGTQAVVAALFSNGNRSFANLSYTLGVDEYSGNNLKIYPNPSDGCFTVEGIGHFTVTNALGQTILTQEIDGQTTINLPRGLYFARMGNVVRKIVVE